MSLKNIKPMLGVQGSDDLLSSDDKQEVMAYRGAKDC
jgi:hypothetical protein